MSGKEFCRHASEQTLDRLREEPLYANRLKADIEAGSVFPAFRGHDEKVDFYHKGGRLFFYESGEKSANFQTHIKYATVLNTEYVSDGEQPRVLPIGPFVDTYEDIKKNCAFHAGPEAAGVAAIYGKSSWARKQRDDVVVLDVEIALHHHDQKANTDRIDILLYKTSTNTLRFYEAKCYGSSDLWTSAGKPAVVDQLTRYDSQINAPKNKFLTAYKKYITAANRLAGLSGADELPAPEIVEQSTVLLVFGFDQLQRPKIEKLKAYEGMNGRRIVVRGNIGDATAADLWGAD